MVFGVLECALLATVHCPYQGSIQKFANLWV